MRNRGIVRKMQVVRLGRRTASIAADIRFPAEVDAAVGARNVNAARRIAGIRLNMSARHVQHGIRVIIDVNAARAVRIVPRRIGINITCRHVHFCAACKIDARAAIGRIRLVIPNTGIIVIHVERTGTGHVNAARRIARRTVTAAHVPDRRNGIGERQFAVYVNDVTVRNRGSTVSVQRISRKIDDNLFSRRNIKRAVPIITGSRAESRSGILRCRPSGGQFKCGSRRRRRRVDRRLPGVGDRGARGDPILLLPLPRKHRVPEEKRKNQTENHKTNQYGTQGARTAFYNSKKLPFRMIRAGRFFLNITLSEKFTVHIFQICNNKVILKNTFPYKFTG